jgi:predicted RNA-binding protein with PUA-like domain
MAKWLNCLMAHSNSAKPFNHPTIQPFIMAYWLIKSEPEAFSLEDFRTEQVTVWNGVRNYTARNNLRAMAFGDTCIFYRSVTKPACIALAKVVREHYPDPTVEGDTWSAVDVELVSEFAQEVSLSQIKEMPELQNMALLRLSRLSVQPVTQEEFDIIISLSKG